MDAVIRAGGLDPLILDKRLRGQVGTLIARHLGDPLDVATELRRSPKPCPPRRRQHPLQELAGSAVVGGSSLWRRQGHPGWSCHGRPVRLQVGGYGRLTLTMEDADG